METIKVDQASCVKCGMCVESCPVRILKMEANGPEIMDSTICIACGHCVSVCPYAALDHSNAPLSNQVAVGTFPVLDAETAERFLRSRRSIRKYKKVTVPQETLLKLLDIARFAPTGGNRQGLSYIIINNPEILKKITAATIDWLEEQIKSNVAWTKGYEEFVSVYRQTGYDLVLRDVPHLIVAIADKQFTQGHDNTRYSLEYVELYATALGLGTCWAGFMEMCAAANYQPMIELLKVPEDKAVTGAMMVGYPQYSYQRLVDRNPLEVTWL